MKFLLKLFLLSLVFLLFTEAFANESQVGIILGSTSGLSAKYDLGADRAVDAGLSYSIDDKYGLSLHIDYLLNKAREFALGEWKPLMLYYGLGARVLDIRRGSNSGSTRVGLRVPVGVYYRLPEPKLEFFGELVPVMDMAPDSEFSIHLGLGGRLIF